MDLGEDEGMDNGGSCSNCALLSLLQLVCPPGCVQSWSVTPCGFENVIQCPDPVPECYSPPMHPMITALESIGAESNEWTRGLCLAGLVSVGGKSGVKVSAVSTVKDSASLLLIHSIPSWSTGTPSSTGPCGPR